MDGETGLLIRGSAQGVLNPYDYFALEAALQAAASLAGPEGPGEVTALTMGPPQAEGALREALALGAGKALLLCDSGFAGADAAITARTLAQGWEKLGVPELIFCGQQTTDGDTAQVPFALAARLGIPAVGWVKAIEYFRAEGFSVLQELSGGTVRVRGGYPALFAIGREAVQPRAASLPRRLEARRAPVTRWTLADLPDPAPHRYGLAASPTRVKRIYAPLGEAKTPPLRVDPGEAAALILGALPGREGQPVPPPSGGGGPG
jgi:electron transfer flavoprotein beta subunit